MLKINGLQKMSTIDYLGKLSCVIFLSGCNYRCPNCHNPQLLENREDEMIREDKILEFLEERGYLDGIVISGGEPTLQPGLENFIKKLRKRRGNLSVKLDTNGSNPEVLKELRKGNLVGYVAMDVKGPPSLYSRIIGKEIDLRDDVEKGIAVVSQFPDYEFRTTIVPIVRSNEEISFMTPEEIGDTAKFIYDCTGSTEHKYVLQPFVPPKNEGGRLLDSRLESFPETPKELLEKAREEARKYLPNCNIR